MKQKITIPIKKLFQLFNAEDIPFEQEFNIPNNVIFMKTETDYAPVQFLIRKKSSIIKYFLGNGETITCSNNHLVFENGVCKKIQDCGHIDTVNGASKIIAEKLICDSGIVYDISIPDPHIYITPNGIKHHNTSLAKLLLSEMDVDSADILEINASHDNGVDIFRDKITNFAMIMPYGDFRYILLDEADYLTKNSQAILRGMMERYSATARFILTANYPHKLIPAIHSRVQSFKMENLDKDEYKYRVATILVAENIECDEDIIDTYIRASYPDLRKCINSMQQNSHNNILQLPSSSSGSGQSDYWISMVGLFKEGKITQARRLICSQANIEEFDDIYRFLYDNLELWGDESNQEQAIVIIKNGLVDHAIIADPEINLSAVLIQLSDLCTT